MAFIDPMATMSMVDKPEVPEWDDAQRVAATAANTEGVSSARQLLMVGAGLAPGVGSAAELSVLKTGREDAAAPR